MSDTTSTSNGSEPEESADWLQTDAAARFFDGPYIDELQRRRHIQFALDNTLENITGDQVAKGSNTKASAVQSSQSVHQLQPRGSQPFKLIAAAATVLVVGALGISSLTRDNSQDMVADQRAEATLSSDDESSGTNANKSTSERAGVDSAESTNQPATATEFGSDNSTQTRGNNNDETPDVEDEPTAEVANVPDQQPLGAFLGVASTYEELEMRNTALDVTPSQQGVPLPPTSSTDQDATNAIAFDETLAALSDCGIDSLSSYGYVGSTLYGFTEADTGVWNLTTCTLTPR